MLLNKVRTRVRSIFNIKLNASIIGNVRICSDTFSQPRDTHREIWREVGTKMVVVSYERVDDFSRGRHFPVVRKKYRIAIFPLI